MVYPAKLTPSHPLMSTPLTSMGEHERQRIVKHYYPFGDPQEMQWQMAVARKYGLSVPDNLAKAGRVYRLWNYAVPAYNQSDDTGSQTQRQNGGINGILPNRKQWLYIIGGGVILGALFAFIVPQLSISKDKRKYDAPKADSIPEFYYSDIAEKIGDMKRLIQHVRLAGTEGENERLDMLLNYNLRDFPGCACRFSAVDECRVCGIDDDIDTDTGMCKICTELASYFQGDRTPSKDELVDFMDKHNIDADDLSSRLVDIAEYITETSEDEVRYGGNGYSERAEQVKEMVRASDTMFSLDEDEGHLLTFVSCDSTRIDLQDAVKLKSEIEERFTDVICNVKAPDENAPTGCVSIKVHTSPSAVKFSALDKSDYPGLFQDTDDDSIPDLDDPRPYVPGDTTTVEEVALTDELGKLIDVHNELNDLEKKFVNDLESLGKGKVLSRTKRPYSMVNKLIRKRLKGRKGLTDLVGGMLVAEDRDEVEEIRKEILSGKFGEVKEEEDFYSHPQNGYMAYHYIIEYNGHDIELQLKTQRMKELSMLSHTPYKAGTLNGDEFLKLTTLANKADEGDKKAEAEIDTILDDPEKVKQLLIKD